MKKNMHSLLCVWLTVLVAIEVLPAQTAGQPIDELLAAVRTEYSGDSALATTAYVEQFWRLPGNAGFDKSIYYVRDLLERAGFREEGAAGPAERLTYRLERRPMERQAWEPRAAQLRIVGDSLPLLDLVSNRNMVLINSKSTPEEGVEAEVVALESCDPALLEGMDLQGKIVLVDCHAARIYREAVLRRGALGVLGYSIPYYNQPERYRQSISFSSIPYMAEGGGWAIHLSYAARERLMAAMAKGPVRVQVAMTTVFRQADELTLVAEVRGAVAPEERFVFSAHVQEPGANDNASGVGCLGEIARVAARLLQTGRIDPARTITFLWGDEITSTRRFVTEDEERRRGIRWGISLDMVGEDTEKTGGTFLIEKMPDPSAIWTRGSDQHTEWGASPVRKEDLRPHYFNDLVEDICRQQARENGWEVRTNPFEGGSDHVPFLNAGVPGLLFWHFTDVFYHTDADRIDKVSAATLRNVGISGLTTALFLTGERTARRQAAVLEVLQSAYRSRMEAERALSQTAVQENPESKAAQREILTTWQNWYLEAASSTRDILLTAEDVNPEAYIKPVQTAMEQWFQMQMRDF